MHGVATSVTSEGILTVEFVALPWIESRLSCGLLAVHGERFFVGAMDSSEAMVLMGLMEKAEKHGVLDEYYRQVKSGKQQDEDMFSWVSSEERFDVPRSRLKRIGVRFLRIMKPGLQFQKIVIAILTLGQDKA